MKHYGEIRNIFMVGIGGSGMSGIAEILNTLGYTVKGSDIEMQNDTITYLKSLGIKIVQGHSSQNLDDAQVVVYSSAIENNNPELTEARQKNLLILKRSEMLSELMRMKFGIAVSGSHGKTTTTSMIGNIIMEAGLDPTIVVGGRVKNLGSSAKIGSGDIMVIEADESDGTFLNYLPAVSVITNIDEEHLDFYKTLDMLKRSFVKFANSVPFYGISIIPYDDANCQSIMPYIQKVKRTYGLSKGADIRGEILQITDSVLFNTYLKNKLLGTIELGIGGIHNAKNALAAIAVSLYLGIPFSIIQSALANFKGVSRRFELRYKGAVKIIEDYGHHPTEIKATLEMAQQLNSSRIIVVFQPHRYSRTKILLKKFPPVFKGIDQLILTDIYPAGEKEIAEVNGRLLYKEFINQGFFNINYVENIKNLIEQFPIELNEGDLIIFQGAGDIRKIIPEFIRKIENMSFQNIDFHKK